MGLFLSKLLFQYEGWINNTNSDPIYYEGCYSLRVNGLKGAGFAALILIIAILAISAVSNSNAVSPRKKLLKKSKKINIHELQEKYKTLEEAQKRRSSERLMGNGAQPETEIVKRISSDQMQINFIYKIQITVIDTNKNI